jgi:RHS repeat-associated protein
MRSLVAGLCLAVTASLVVSLPASAGAAPPVRPAAPAKLPSVPGTDLVAGKPPVDTVPALKAAPAVTWPGAGTAEVALDPAAAPSALAATSPSGTKAAWKWATGLPVAARAGAGAPARSLSAAASGTPVSRVALRVYDRAAAQHAGYDLVVRASRADGIAAAGPVSVAVGYGTFANAYGGNWASRLKLVALPECALTTPAAKECAATDVPTANDAATKTVTADVSAAPQGTLLALTAGSSSDGGDFGVTDLKPSSAWTAGGSAGGFSWNYPMTLPGSLGGPAPSVQLGYSSQGVDGQTAATNAQPSWVGEGFSWQPGSIERAYRVCSDDGQSSSKDACWAGDNAKMSLNGSSVDLIYDSASGQWRPGADDGSKIERLTDTSLGNGDHDGQYWRVTATNGIQYYFGLNKLPGAPAGTTTDSVFYEPVYGNNDGEPCHAATFAASSCQWAYRWNLDYVVDPHGNTMSMFYTRETNQYARNGSSSDTPTYIRNGYIREIDYGTRQDNGVDSVFAGTAPQRVRFDVADRCVTPGTTCTTAVANKANWPDVPLDLLCTGTACAGKNSPSFFTTKMLSAVTTEIATGTKTWRRVAQYTLGHEFKSPGDGHAAILWLANIGHCGTDDNICMPKVQFTATQRSNRVDMTGSTDSIIRFRIQAITNETGGITTVNYSGPDCVAGTRMPANPESNTLRCFPQYWYPIGATTPKMEYFHKYVVTSVAEGDILHSADMVTYYTYLDSAAWHHDDSLMTLPARRTWNDWRGYGDVQSVRGASTDPQLKSETIYFRGMDGDTLPNNGTRSVSVTDSDGVAHADSAWFNGQSLESMTYFGTTSTVLSRVRNEPAAFGPTATATVNGVTLKAYVTQVGSTTSKLALDHAPSWRTTRTTTTFSADRYMRPIAVDDEGDVSTTADDRCTRFTLGANSAGTLVTLPVRTETVDVKCSATPDRSKDVLADARFRYDGAAGYGTTVGKGDLTATEQMTAWNGGSPTYLTTANQTYDANGRPLVVTDSLGRTLTTAYTPPGGAPVTNIVQTNVKGWTTSTTIDPGTGKPLVQIDANGRRTEATYDGLGRITAVWLPGRTKDVDLPNSKFAYTIRNSGGPTVITTSKLNTAGTGYVTTYQIFDGFLRPRQAQSPAVGGGRAVTETIYDSRGLTVKSRPAYYNSSAPAATLFVPAADTAVPNQTVMSYDGAGRQVRSTVQVNAVEFSHVSTYYGGDHMDVTVPAGGSATSSWSDARGKMTELRIFKGSVPAGAYDTSTRTYTANGDLAAATDPAGNKWSWTYDQQQHKMSETAPDRGTIDYTYDSIGEVLTATNDKNVTLSYTYDELGRRTGLYAGSVTPANLRVSYVYDTLSKGKLTSATRYDNGSAYTVATTGFDVMDRPTSTKVTIPAAAGTALAGDYTSSSTYNADGSPHTATAIAKSGASTIGGLAAETLTYGYNELGMPTTLTGQDTYVTDTQYLQTGELSSLNTTTGNGKNVLQYWIYDPGTMRLAEHEVLADLNPVVVQDSHYAYDTMGNITSIADQLDQYGAGADDTQCFAYDGTQRLTEAWTPSSGDCNATRSAAALGGPAPYWKSYTYTAAGERKTETRHSTGGDLVRTTAYPASGPTAVQPHAATSITNSGTSTTTDTFAYDVLGNMTTRAIAGQAAQTLTWSPENLLTSVSDTSGTTSYVYDAEGGRLLSKSPAQTVLYLGSTELKLSGSTVTATRYYSHAGKLVAVRTPDGLSWQTTDGQGTAQLSLRATDLAVTRRRTDPFGNVRGGAVTWPTSRGFVGGIGDPTGLTHLGAREYDPVTGSFISTDPMLDIADLQQMGTYNYADNNPVTRSDPTGTDPPGGNCEVMHLCGSDGKRHDLDEVGDGGTGPVVNNPDFQHVVWDSKKDPVGKRNTKKHIVVFRHNNHVVAQVTCTEAVRESECGGWSMYTVDLGPVSECGGGNGTRSSSPVCWTGTDGHTHDMFGNKSCREAGSTNFCSGGQEPVIVLGCGPGGLPYNKDPSVVTNPSPPASYMYRAGHTEDLPEWMRHKEEGESEGINCEGRGEQCKVAMVVDKLVWASGFCWAEGCAAFGFVGGMAVAAYYFSEGEYSKGFRKMVMTVVEDHVGEKGFVRGDALARWGQMSDLDAAVTRDLTYVYSIQITRAWFEDTGIAAGIG